MGKSGSPYCTAESIARGIEILQQSGATAHIELLRAVERGMIAMVFVTSRKAKLDLHRIGKSKLPVMVWIGDDDYQTTGPDGWRCARMAASWCRAAMVHGSGAAVEHYQAAVLGTIISGRALLIETSSAFVDAWAALMPDKRVVKIVPTGGVHPVPLTRRDLH